MGIITGRTDSLPTKGSFSTVAEKMRDLMIENSEKFAGVVDAYGDVMSGISGKSESVSIGGYKIAQE